jgi:hypothetical protein
MVKPAAPIETSQTMQRIRVGVTGLAIVLLLIGLAGVIFNAVNRERPIAAIGGAKPETVAAIADSNGQAGDQRNEPLADLGVAPANLPENNQAASRAQ